MTERRHPCSPLDVLENTFDLLTRPPATLVLHGGEVGHGLPRRQIPLDELRSMLLHPSTPFARRDAVLVVLVRSAQRDRQRWLVGLAGVLLPGLRRTAARLARDYPGVTADLDAEILVGLIEAVEAFDLKRPSRVASRLLWAAYRRGDRLRRAELGEAARRARTAASHAPRRPWGHPDLVLARAVQRQVITAAEGRLIGETRLGALTVAEVARRLGVRPDTLRHQRRRAEGRLAAWLLDGNGTDADLAVPFAGRKPGLEG